MKLIKLGAAALNQTPLDWEGNTDNIKDVISKAFIEEIDILCLPELCITGYNCEDAFFMPYVLEKSFECLEYIAKYTTGKNIILNVGLPICFDKSIYNCAAVISNGKIHAIIPKQNICADGVHYESRWFKPWPINKIDTYKEIPIGDIVIDYNISHWDTSVRFGFEICEDAWVSNRPGIRLAERSIDVILNPSASHFAFGKNSIRTGFIKEGSRAFKCAYVYSNLLGNESGRTIYDGSTYIATGGNIVAQGPQLSFTQNTLISSMIDIDVNTAKQLQNISHTTCHANVVNVKSFIGKINSPVKNNKLPIENSRDDFEDFTKAVSLGLFDYMRKSKSKGFVLSLSGGADSATVALLVKEMVSRVLKELGISLTLKMLNLSGDVIGDPEKFIINKLLTCIYQATENSSAETELAAKHLAQSIGASYHSISVQSILENYISLSKEILNRDITWETDDIALQNIQARVRAPSVWMIANIKQALLLVTSNRSEAAVGYCTAGGDDSGSLSPIGGVSKQFILNWLRDYEASSLNKEFDGLRYVLAQKPTAELRPKESNQTDEQDLMPYAILNRIEIMFVRDKMSPDNILSQLNCDGINDAEKHVKKFFKLFCQNQWKRERYAPSFHLDDESLDPKTFFRFPILNAGL